MKTDMGHRRLSKPRSLKHSTTKHGDAADQSTEEASLFAHSVTHKLEADFTMKPRGSRRSKSKPRSRIRDYLHGSPGKASNDASSDENITISPSQVSDVSKKKAKNRLSRSASIFTQRSSARGSATILSNMLTDTANLDDTDDVDDTEIIVNQIKQRAQHDTVIAGNHKRHALDEETHADSFLPPIRRKSLFTPGLATRNASDILRKPCAPSAICPQSPLSEADLSYYYDRSHSKESPLACLAALKLADDGRATPASLNIPNLGGLRSGTLRVTNGVVSPLPMSPRPFSAPNSPALSLIDQDEFQTASEGSICEPKSSNPSVAVFRRDSVKSGSSHDLAPVLQDSDRRSPVRDTLAAEQPAVSSSIALDYIAELDRPPFSTSEPCSRHESPVESIDDGATAGLNKYSLPPRMVHHVQTSIIVSTNSSRGKDRRPCPVTFSSETLPITSRTIVTTTTTPTRDSGYYSRESFDAVGRTMVFDDQEYQKQTIPPHEKNSELGYGSTTCDADIPLNLQVTANDSEITTPRYRAGGRKLQKVRPNQKVVDVRDPTRAALHTSISDTEIPRVPSAMAERHAQRLVDFPTLEHTYPSLNHVTASVSPLLNHTTPSAMQLPQFYLETREHEDPARRSRGQETNSSAADRSTENRKLIRKAEELRRREGKSRLRLLEQEEERRERDAYGGSKASDWRSRAVSRIRSKSTDRRSSKCEPTGTIADLGTVAHSIGCSPYDIATVISPKAGIDRRSYFPHQLGAVKPRPRSFVGMDDLTASEFAHTRSRHRQRSPLDRPKTICVDTSTLGNIAPYTPGTTKTGTINLAFAQNDLVVSTQAVHMGSQPFQKTGGREKPVAQARSTNLSIRAPTHPLVTGDRTDPDGAELHGRFTASHESSRLLADNLPKLQNWHIPKQQERSSNATDMVSDQTCLERQLQACDRNTINWERPRSAWRQRRKSAGQALLGNQLASEGTIHNKLEHDCSYGASSNQRAGEASPRRKPVVSPTIAALAGRYEGGFDFGFEHGCGVGGSAGTRSIGDSAVRKSGEVSKGFGLDLSDLPVFITQASNANTTGARS